MGIAGIGGSASLGNAAVGIGGKVGFGSVGIVGRGGNWVVGNGGNVGIGNVGIAGSAGAAGAVGVSKRWRAAKLASMLNKVRNRAKRILVYDEAIIVACGRASTSCVMTS